MRRPLFVVALCLVIVAVVRLGAGWADAVPPGCLSAKQLEEYDKLTITGQVYQKDEKSIYLKSVFIIGSEAFGQSAVDSRQRIPCQENIICETEAAPAVPLGSIVTLEGVFYPCSRATNPGEFDSAIYYRTLEVGGRLRKARLLEQGQEHWAVREALYGLRIRLKERLYRIFPEKEASVMSALLLGDKTDLDGELKDLYKRNGILHILSISSLHITIIGMSVYKLFRKMGMPICPAAVAGGVLLVLYGCMTGFSVSACRAIGMYLIKMLAEIVGRTYDMLTALGVMAAVMVTKNPYYLMNSGFLLSFGSVLGIGVVYPALLPEMPHAAPGRKEELPEWAGRFPACFQKVCQEFGKGVRRVPGELAQSAFLSLSITLATLPAQLWFYYEIPVYSVLLNLLVLPFMKLVIITGLVAMFVPGLGGLGLAACLVLRGYEFLCGCFDKLPFRSWNPGCPQLWQIVIYYIALAGVVMARAYSKEGAERKADGGVSAGSLSGPSAGIRASRLSIVQAGVLAAAVLVFAVRPFPEESVTFLDVGQGDCIVVRTDSGQTYLFDCGSSSRSSIGKYILLPYLKYNGIRRVDAVFLSHPDADHVNGAVELLETGGENQIAIGQLLLPAIEEEAREEKLGELLAAARAGKGVPVGYLSAGDSWTSGSTVFTCLHPPNGFGAEDINASSECFLVQFGAAGGQGMSLLLTGDVQGEGESVLLEELEKRGIGRVTVLKAAHHGSKNSTPKELLEQLTPRLTVISCGRRNRYGHPHKELIGRLEESGTHILQTAQSGAITVTFRHGNVVASVAAGDG